MNKKMNIKDLREELSEVLDKLKNKEIKLEDAVAYGSVSSKVLMTAKVELDYHKHMGYQKAIDFLETD